MQNINLELNILCKEAIVTEEDKNINGGTSIAQLLQQRQHEEIEQIMIDKLCENNEEVKIDDILEELII